MTNNKRLSTSAFAKALGVSAGSIRNAHYSNGNYKGVTPTKKINSHLEWPASAVDLLKAEFEATKHNQKPTSQRIIINALKTGTKTENQLHKIGVHNAASVVRELLATGYRIEPSLVDYGDTSTGADGYLLAYTLVNEPSRIAEGATKESLK